MQKNNKNPFEITANPEYSQYIHLSRYSRWRDDLNRRETWSETVDRLCTFWESRFPEYSDYIRNKIQPAVYNLEVMPSMRSLMTAGPALDRDEVAAFNCSYLAIDSPRCFDELMYILMCGTGVGFSVERQYVNKMPEVAEELYETDTTVVFSDSKIGWASGFRELISLLYAGKIPKLDFSKIRPAGARLKTFGGRASGPGPLKDLCYFTINLFRDAAGSKLSSIQAHDLACKIAEIVVVGGVRRSALISLSNLSDDRMRGAKSGQWWNANAQRALANNSYVADERPHFDVFLNEWVSLHESKSGERGIFSRKASKKQAENTGRRDPDYEFGTNPCSEIILRDKQFCVSGDTPLITKDGIERIGEKENESVTIWNGKNWSNVTVRKTGENQDLVRVNFSDGSYLDCTPDHKFSVKDRFMKDYVKVEAQELMNVSKHSIHVQNHNISSIEEGEVIDEDAYTLGFAVGDGCVYNDRVLIDLYGEKDINCPVKGNRQKKTLKENYNIESQRVFSKDCTPQKVKDLKTDVKSLQQLASLNRKQLLEFIAGWIDADGSNTSTGNSVRLYISNEERARVAQLLLTRCGIRSSVNLAQKIGTRTNKGERKESLWYLQIASCSEIPCYRVDTSKTIDAKFKGKNQNVKSVEILPGKHDTFCFKEYETGMALFSNVLTYQCNLTEVIVRENDDAKSLKKKAEIATVLGTFQASLTNFRYLRKKWADNTKEEALLGVSMTGIMDNPILNGLNGKEELKKTLDTLREHTIKTNKEWADKIGINQSASITAVKPSGTVSQLTDTASGIHPRFADYYLRTVRADIKDPLADFMIQKGFYYEEDKMNPNNYVFYFPMKSPDSAVTGNTMGAIEQLELWKVYQDHWTEHKPSMTCYYKDSEFLEVGQWVWDNFNDISGVSFLPYDDHIYPQAPYQPINKETYDYWLNEMMPHGVNWNELGDFESEDHTEGSQELACSAPGGCEI